MAGSRCRWECPEQWSEWSEWLAAGMHARNRWRLPVLMMGMLLARGRRTVTSWLRGAGISDDYQDYYYFLTSVGRNSKKIASQLVVLVQRRLSLPERVLVVIDDSPTKRYGPKVEGAALRDLPPKRHGGRGRPRKYGKNRISLTKRAGQTRGWLEMECTAYGKTIIKTYKTFLATYTPVGSVIRVVLVKEEHGWYAFYCTDPAASAVKIVEAFADRATIEQDFHDVKEVWGAGQQQVRNIWNNLAVYNLNLWMHTLVELWAWDRTAAQLTDRSDSPWDDPERRPSHADRRKALRAQILRNELLTITAEWSLPRKMRRLAEKLVALAA